MNSTLTVNKLDHLCLYGQSILIHDDDDNRQLAFIKSIIDNYIIKLIITNNKQYYKDNNINALFIKNYDNLLYHFDLNTLFGGFGSSPKLFILDNINDEVINSKFFSNLLITCNKFNITLIILNGINKLFECSVIKTNINYVLFHQEHNTKIQYQKIFMKYPPYNFLKQAFDEKGSINRYICVHKNSTNYVSAYHKFSFVEFNTDDVIPEYLDIGPEDIIIKIII